MTAPHDIADLFARASLLMAGAEVKALTKAELASSYKGAIDLHLHRADRLLLLASKLNASPSLRRRAIALPAIQEARKRVVAAETCDVLLCGIDHVPGQRSSHLPWVAGTLGAPKIEPNIKEKIDIILTFLNVTPFVPTKRQDPDDDIPF